MCHTGINCKNDLLLYATNKTDLFMKYDTGRVESVSGGKKKTLPVISFCRPNRLSEKH